MHRCSLALWEEKLDLFSLDAFLPVTPTMPLIDDGFEALLEPFYNGKKLTDPVSTKEDKFQLLPAFLKVKGMSIFLESYINHLLLTRILFRSR